MACCPTQEKKYGYDDSRFEKDVDEHFHCSICYNVLKDPRMCRNDHAFCLDCITEHLKVNSQTCPECNDHLTVDTLRRARLVNNYLSKLKINCDHASRGCPEFVCVENLESHVESCGFSPVMCSNESCGMEINKQDKNYHENEVCEYRKVKCEDCGKTQEVVERLEGSLIELDENVGKNHVDMKKIVGKLEGSLVGMNKMVNEKVETLKGMNKMVNERVETLTEMNKVGNRKVEAMRNRQEEVQREVKREVGEVKKEVKDVKENLFKVNKDVVEVKVMMSQVLEKLNMLEHLNKLPSPTERMLNTPREDILIAGGYGNVTGTEIFSWEKNDWFEVSPMNEEHARASSFIYKDQVFVVGGIQSKTIETLDLNVLPLKWRKFAAQLPYDCRDHQTVVYRERVIHIGGFNSNKREWSNLISELQLNSPYTVKELCQMPELRVCYQAEIFEDKVLILGGQKSTALEEHLDSVLEFDVKTNQCKEMPPLPRSLTSMATVQWRDQIIVLGGRDKDNKVVSDVFMYDCKAGKITVLPSMLEKRCACCAVITGNTIVVMGGYNEKREDLKSVECFAVGGSTWEYLSAMNKVRYSAVAEVLPSTRKSV